MDDVVGRPRLFFVDRFSALFPVQSEFVEDAFQNAVQNVFVARRFDIYESAFFVGVSDDFIVRRMIDATSFLGADDDLSDREGRRRRRRFAVRLFRKSKVVEISSSFVLSFKLLFVLSFKLSFVSSFLRVEGFVAPAEKAR